MAPHGKVLVNASIRHRLCKNDSSHLSKASRKQSKKKVRQSFESTNISEIFNVSSGGQPHTLSSERDFKSLVSASLRQSRFSFVVSFDLSLRERFFLREREGFAFFWQDNITTFFAPCQSCKIVSSCRAWSSERPGPGATAGAFALPRCAPQGGGDEGLMSVLMDGIEWWISSDFWRDWSCFDVLIALIISYLWCSLLFICPASTLPCYLFCRNFPGSDFGLWNKKQVYYCSI